MPKSAIHIISVSLLLLLSSIGAAQNIDSTFSQVNLCVSSNHHLPLPSTINKDILLDFLPGYSKYSPFLNFQAGNDGNKILPTSLLQRSQDLPDPFSKPILPFLSSPTSINLIESNKPFTFLNFYQAGPEDESFQKIQIIHSQRLSNFFDFGFSAYNHIANGSFQNEQNKTYQVNLWSKYLSESYNALILIDLHSLKSMENGGLSNDSVFLSGNFDNPKFDLNVNLSNARSTISSKSIKLFNNWILKNDSSSYNISIQLNSFAELQQRTYQDEGSNLLFYQSLGLDSVFSFDSLAAFSIKNQPVLILSNENQKILPDISFGLTHLYTNAYYSGKMIDNSLQLNAAAKIINLGRFNLSAGLDYQLMGYYLGDLDMKFLYEQKYDSAISSNWQFKAQYTKKHLPLSASMLMEQIIQNQLLPQENTVLSAHYKSKSKSFGCYAFAGILSNYIYFNEDAQLLNHNESEAFLESGISYSISEEHINWNTNISLQWMSKPQVIDYSWWLVNSSFEYKNSLFSNKLDFSIGTSLWLNESSFYPAYNPVFGTFYEQRVIESNFVPWIDVYIKFRIKTAGFFVRYENLLAIRGYKYQYLIADFPAQMPRLGFGVNWYMFD